MAMVKCKACGQVISKKAAVCPSCGEPQKRKSIGCVGALVILVVAVALAVTFVGEQAKKNPPAPPTAEQLKQKELDSLKYIAQYQLEGSVKQSLHNPDSYKFVDSESQVLENGGIDMTITYRATNAFGGVVTEQVAGTFDKDGKLIKGPTRLER
jgi:hypothetical protein